MFLPSTLNSVCVCDLIRFLWHFKQIIFDRIALTSLFKFMWMFPSYLYIQYKQKSMAEAQMELKEQTIGLLKLMLLHLVRQDQDTYQLWPECHNDDDERQVQEWVPLPQELTLNVARWSYGLFVFLWWICSCCPCFFNSTNKKIFFFLTAVDETKGIFVSTQRCQRMQELMCIVYPSAFSKKNKQ